MTHGPKARPIRSAVSAAITARKVMYWKTRKKPNSGDRPCSHWARLSSMAAFRRERGHHLLHLHEPRALDDDRGGGWRRAERRDERGHVVEVARTGEGGAGVGAEAARGPQVLDAALGRIRAHLLVKGRALRAHFAHVAQHQPARRRQG